MQLKLTHKELLELSAAIAVVGSLAFVGLQLKLDRDIALANSFADQIESRKEDYRAKLESDAYMSMQETLWEAGARPSWWSDALESYEAENLQSGAQIIARYYEVELDYLELERINFRYEHGLIDEGYWLGARQTLRAFLQDPFRRAVILSRGSDITDTVTQLVAEIDGVAQTR